MRTLCTPLLGLILLLPHPVEAQSERDEALATVQELFDAMEARDGERLAAVLLPEGQLVVHQIAEDGSATTSISPHRDFIERVRRADQPLIERMWNSEVHVQGALASVWTEYDFYRGETFSHCGVEVFNLLRIDGSWKIVGGTYTVEPHGCPPSPLGPPDRAPRDGGESR